MILETIVSTINDEGKVNFAPFGIKKDDSFLLISPYIPSTTLLNLEETMQATVNYVNDSSFFVNCILKKKNFKKKKCLKINGYYLAESEAHDEVIVDSIIKDNVRPTFKCKVIRKAYHKRYEGFNRADGAIIEACILASRVKILKKKMILESLNNLENSVIKTAGNFQKKSWSLIKKFILDEI